MLQLRCPKHKDYKGIKAPRVTCVPCQSLFHVALSNPGIVYRPIKKKTKSKKSVPCY